MLLSENMTDFLLITAFVKTKDVNRQYLFDLKRKMPKIDTLDPLGDEMTSILNTL